MQILYFYFSKIENNAENKVAEISSVTLKVIWLLVEFCCHLFEIWLLVLLCHSFTSVICLFWRRIVSWVVAAALTASSRCAGSACVVEVALVSHAPVWVDRFGCSEVDRQLAVLRLGGAQAICHRLSGLRQGEMVATKATSHVHGVAWRCLLFKASVAWSEYHLSRA